MFKSSYLAYWKPYNFNNISLTFGIGYGFRFNCLFIFLKSFLKLTRFYSVLGCAKDGDPHSESFDTSRTPNKTKRSTSFLNISSYTVGTGYGCNHIGFATFFSSKSTGSVFKVPSVPSNNSSNICNNFSDPLHCVIIRYWYWVSITLFKYYFSYLASNIACYFLVGLHTCSGSYTS